MYVSSHIWLSILAIESLIYNQTCVPWHVSVNFSVKKCKLYAKISDYFGNHLLAVIKKVLMKNLKFLHFSTYVQFFCFFFLSKFSFTGTGDSQNNRQGEGTSFYSTLPLPPAHEYSDIYLQLCMWDDYHIFLIASLVLTRLLLDEIYQLFELPFDWLMMWS